MPVKEGFISGKFGRQEHPILPKVWIENIGIDIRTNEAEKVYAVSDGKVTAIKKVPGMEHVIMIQHGEYFTVYAKLKEVFVKRGQQINEQALIGTVAPNEEGISELQFQIWHHQTRLDPQEWLAQ